MVMTFQPCAPRWLTPTGPGKVVAGIESGVAGLGIRGVAPVSKDGRHLGTVEFGAALGDPLLKSFTMANGSFAAIYVPDAGPLKPIGSTLPARIADDIQKLAQNSQGFQYWEDESVSDAWTASTLLDYAGKPVATASSRRISRPMRRPGRKPPGS